MKIAGLMSGTSLDGVDAALIETDGTRITGFGPGLERPYSKTDRAVLAGAVEAALAWRFQGEEPEVFAGAEAVLTRTHAQAVHAVCDRAGIAPGELDLVGFHGQTVLHRAPAGGVPGRTRQIGDGQALADMLNCPVAFDFRTGDVAAGGQGAPLAPVYHAALVDAAGLERPVGVLNLGGVGNITHVGADGDLIAFDTGPANGLIDAFMEERTGTAMDTDGAAAAQGRAHEGALADYLGHAHFEQAGPKSLDRWDFSLDPVRNLTTQDGAATLSVLTARTVALGLDRLPQRPRRLIVCGGGRRNPTLLALIEHAAGLTVHPAEAVGWRGDLIEAEAFAYLAARTAMGLPISFPGTTGVKRAMTGGRVVRPRS